MKKYFEETEYYRREQLIDVPHCIGNNWHPNLLGVMNNFNKSAIVNIFFIVADSNKSSHLLKLREP